jgi:hypothetical protein
LDDDDDDDDDVDISRALDNIRQAIKDSATENLGMGYYELKQHNPKFDEKCSNLLDQRKPTIQWLHNPGHTNCDKLNNVRRETSKT